MSNVLGASQTLNQNSSLWSPNRMYELRMQDDGNLVLYRAGQANAVWNAWESNWKFPGDHPKEAAVKMQNDGNLVIYSHGRPMWESDSHNAETNTYSLTLQDDGNLVITDSGTPIWENGAQQ